MSRRDDGGRHVKQVGGVVVSLSVRQTSYRLTCEVVRAALIDAVESEPGAVGLVQHRAMAALYEVLLDHPVDRRSRCRSCRRPAAVLGWRRRRCRVHIETTYWLHQPDEEFLRSQLTQEFGLADPPPSGLNTAPRRRSTGAGAADDRDGTVALPAADSLPSNGSIAVPQPPTVSSPPSLPSGFPRAGRPDPDHGAGTIHGLGASGVTLSAADMIALAESILAHAQPGGAR